MIGRTLGNYRVVEQIGMGGMATVYKAYDPDTDRYVALKILPEHYSKDPNFQERFRREAKAIARLEHIHILPVHGYGEQEGTSYLVMRLMETGTLSDRIKRGPIPLEEASRLLSQIASALDHAHSQGIIHRDIKPSNILLDRNNNAFLTDFGIAKMVEGSTIDLTGTGIVGTPQYMSPEQCRGEKNLTAASDIYSLGVVAYEMITGRAPFQAETPLAVIHMQLNEPLPPPRSLRPELSERIESVVLKALAKQPESRYPTCAAMADAFAQAVSQHIARFPADAEANQRTITPSTEPTRPVDTSDSQTEMLPRKRRIPIWAIALVALVVLGAIVVMGLLTNCCAPPPTVTLTANAIIGQLASDTPTSSETPAPTATPDFRSAAQATNDVEATINAERTALYFEGQTAEATLWTATPAPTETLTDTPTITNTPTPAADAFIAQGDAAAAQGDYEAAITSYSQAIEVDPSSAAAYYGRGITYISMEQWEQAVADFTQAITINPNDANSHYHLGDAHAALGDLDAAIEDFTHAIELDPTSPDAYNRRADVYSAQGDYDAAFADFAAAIEIDPNSAWAYNNRGYADMAVGDFEQAIADFTHAIELDPNWTPGMYTSRGNAYLSASDYEAAIADFERTIQFNLGSIQEAYYGLGDAHAALGDLETAIEDFTHAIELDPTSPGAYIRRADVYSAQGNYDAAFADFAAAIEIDPDMAWAYNNRGYADMAVGDFEQAIEDFTRVIELDINWNSEIYIYRGDAYRLAGNNEAAIADYTQAIELNPESVWAYSNRGESYLQLEDYDNALADSTRAIALDSTNASAYHLRGRVYIARGDNEQAIPDLERAIELNPDFVIYIYHDLGDVYFGLGDCQQAIENFTTTIELDANYASGYVRRADVYQYCLGDSQQAILDYNRAIELEPSFAHAYINRGRAYIALGDLDSAIADFTRTIELQPDFLADAYWERGHAYDTQGNSEATLADYHAYLELAGENPDSYVVQRIAELESPAETITLIVANFGGVIRAIPQGAGERLATVTSGQELIATGISLDGNYYRVDYNGQEGWISVRFVNDTDTSSLPVIEAVQDIEVQTVTVSNFGGVIRSAPHGDAERLATVNSGQELTATAMSLDGNYYRVEYDGQVGWISARFVTESSGDDAGTAGDAAYVEGAELFYDDFEDGSADNWELESGAEIVQDTPGNYVLRIVAPEGDNYIHTAVGDTVWENYALEFRVRVVDTASDGTYVVGINVRIDWSREGCIEYFTGLEDWGSYLQRDGDENCPTTTLAEIGEMTIGADDWHTVRLEVYGDTVSVYIDGALILSAVDSEPILSGSFGLEADRGTTAYFDDVRVVELIPTDAVSQQGVTAVIVGSDRVNLRSGPGTTFDVVASANGGDQLTVIGQNANGFWLLVRTASGESAWIAASLIELQGNLDAVPITSG